MGDEQHTRQAHVDSARSNRAGLYKVNGRVPCRYCGNAHSLPLRSCGPDHVLVQCTVCGHYGPPECIEKRAIRGWNSINTVGDYG